MKKIGIIFFMLALLVNACKKDSPEDQIIFQDSFVSNKGWTIGGDNYSSFSISNGQYQMMLDTSGAIMFSFAPYGFNPYSGEINYPYSLKVVCSMALKDESKVGSAGFVFNFIDGDNFSYAIIYSMGLFSLIQKIDGIFYKLGSGETSAILVGSSVANSLELIQKASTLEFKVNGQTVGTFQKDKANTDVRVGLMIMTHSDNFYTGFTASFKDFVLTKLQ
jgi:hypothetical protein